MVQECHIWLNLAEMWDAEKVCFLYAHSQGSLFGNTVSQQLSPVKKQIEVIKHILSRHGSTSRPLLAQALAAHHRGWPAKAALVLQQPGPATRPQRSSSRKGGTASLPSEGGVNLKWSVKEQFVLSMDHTHTDTHTNKMLMGPHQNLGAATHVHESA